MLAGPESGRTGIRQVTVSRRMLAHLIGAGQWDRAPDLAPSLLAEDPEDWHVHAMIAHAALNAPSAKMITIVDWDDQFAVLIILMGRLMGKSSQRTGKLSPPLLQRAS